MPLAYSVAREHISYHNQYLILLQVGHQATPNTPLYYSLVHIGSCNPDFRYLKTQIR